MAELFDMGEHAVYVWAGWGLTALVLGGMAVLVWIERRRARARLEQARERSEAA